MKQTNRRVLLFSLVFISAIAAHGRGTEEVNPNVQLTNESGVYISPNGDGVSDNLELAAIPTGDATLAIKAFELTIFATSGDSAGQVVRDEPDVTVS